MLAQGGFMEDAITDGRTRSGKARMAKLTAGERRDLARKAAQARWESVASEAVVQRATHMGEITLADGGVFIPCAVLEDGARVLTQVGFLGAIGRRGKPKNTFRDTEKGFTKIAVFLQAENLQEFISMDLEKESTPVPFRLPDGRKAWAYRADLLPKVC